MLLEVQKPQFSLFKDFLDRNTIYLSICNHYLCLLVKLLQINIFFGRSLKGLTAIDTLDFKVK